MDHELTRIKKLDGIDNWNLWKFQIKILLKSNEAWEVVNGKALPTVPAAGASAEDKKVYEKDLAAWHKGAHATAQKVIVTTISEQCMLHIISCDNAKSMWDRLIAIYEKKSETWIHALQQQWYTITKNPEDDI